MILSIGMIVKNEEKYLRRCLEALSPVLAQVDAELIIADTGSADGTVGIARQFTDAVFHFDWCDDFSAARNATLSKAKGEWFFFIDADEILFDTDALIEFFASGAYKAFNAAAITIRSGNDATLSQWADNAAVRLIKRRGDSSFVNAVHEHFGRIYPPVKMLDTVALHYGYVTQDNAETIARKMDRNLRLALAELEKNPRNHMMYLHACNACNMAGDLKKALFYCEQGYRSAKESGDPLQYEFFAQNIALHARMKDHEQVVALADAYFLSKDKRLKADLQAAFLRAESCFLLQRYGDAIRSFLDYFELLGDTGQTDESAFAHTVLCADDQTYLFGVLRLAHAYLKQGDAKAAKRRLRSRAFADYMRAHPAYWLEVELALMQSAADYSGLPALYAQLDAQARTLFIAYAEQSEPAVRASLCRPFNAPGAPADDYTRLLALRDAFASGTLEAGAVAAFFADAAPLPPLFADAAYFAVQTGLPPEAVAPKIDALELASFFCGNPYCRFDGLAQQALRAYGEAPPADAGAALWLACLYQTELVSGCQDAALFRAYAAAARAAMTALFAGDVLTDDGAAALPRCFRAAYFCYSAEQARADGRTDAYIRYLRMAVQADPRMKELVQYLADRLQSALNGQDEFLAHAATVKATIRQLLDGGKNAEAAELAGAYEKLCPADPDIAAMKRRLLSP